MIQTRDLTKTFGSVIAVDAIDLDVEPGSIVGFLGPNGAGKSTTIRMICGYLTPTRGTVRVGDIDVHASARNSLRARRRLGYLPESAPAYSEMQVTEFLHFRGGLYGMSRADRKSRIGYVLDRCALHDVRRRPIGQLSKGFRQRVGLAAALLHDPELLILDEPTAGLDPVQVGAFRRLLRELSGRRTILLSTHILAEVEQTCDRFIMIAGGRIRRSGRVDALEERAVGPARYRVEVRDTDLVAGLGAVTGVAATAPRSLEDGWVEVTVTADEDAPDLRPALARHLADRPDAFRELHRRRPSLEDLFLATLRTDPGKDA